MFVKPIIVLSTFRMFRHPTVRDHPFRPVRMILGGKRGGGKRGGNDPKITSDYMEMYIRLPLFAEWYREVFSFKKITRLLFWLFKITIGIRLFHQINFYFIH